MAAASAASDAATAGPALNDPPGAIACAKLAAAITHASLMEDGVVADIATASTEADAPLADAAQRLASAHAAATQARGSADEPDATAAVSAAAADMHGVCADSGLTTTG
jgi:hypothetical protein